MEPPAADLIVVDECHHIRARTWHDIIAQYPGVPLIGLTATPCRGDGRGLGEVFDVIVECPHYGFIVRMHGGSLGVEGYGLDVSVDR
jgi:type I site-specific restriction endonuclease